MPILPIDLQILFSQMNQVGKEQAAQKEGAALQSSIQNAAIVKQTEQKDSTVNESRDIGEGIEGLKNEAKGKPRMKQDKKRRRDDGKEGKKESYSDPALGHHVDIES